MILPIIGFGHPTLRKIAQPVPKDYPNLKELIDNMFETMYNADGVGLAAPQVDLSIRLVTVGVRPYDEKTETYGDPTEVHVLINPEILEFKGEKKYFNEGCLSVPDIHEDVLRPDTIVLHWWDENWTEHTEEIGGLFARIAQHEIDHLDGKVFTDRISPFRKTMIKSKMKALLQGRYRCSYRTKAAVK